MKNVLRVVVLLLAMFAGVAHATKTCARLTEGNYIAGGTTTDSASISPSANSAVVASVVAFDSVTMAVAGNGLTWTTLVNGEDAGGGGRIWVFIGAGASPSSGVITFTFDDGAFLNWAVDGITGTVNVSAPSNSNVIAATGIGTAVAATLGAFAHMSNGVWAYGYAQDSATVTQGSGFNLIDNNVGTALFEHTDWSQCMDSNDTSVDATLSDAVTWGMVAFEIVDSASGASGLLLRRRRN